MEGQIEESSTATAANPRRPATPEELQRQHKLGELKLSRSRVAQQMEASSNERYSAMLRQALADLDRQISALGD